VVRPEKFVQNIGEKSLNWKKEEYRSKRSEKNIDSSTTAEKTG
jgi:hypothetical protein